MPKFIYFILFSAGLFMLQSCTKDTLIPESPSFNYFPNEKGAYVIYNVDSIVHSTNDNNNDDSVYYYYYQLKVVIDSAFIDGEGHERRVVVRYFRADSTQPWTVRNVWSQLLTNAFAYRYEDNIAYHKMAFPISTDITWDGNDKNTLPEEMYRYKNLHKGYSLNNIQYDSTLTVLQRDDNNFVEKIYGEEKYAAGVGLIYKQRDDLRKTAGLVVSGTEYKLRAITFGNE